MKELKLKIYECSKDGLPDVGRPFIAFRKTHEEHEIYTRCDKDKILAQNWDNADQHISPDGEFYSGAHHWIYHVDYESYVYVDELNLIPQSHFDKVAKEKEEAATKLKALKEALIKEYGEENGTKLQRFILVEKDERRVSLYGFYEYLLKPFEYPEAVAHLFKDITENFDENFAKEIINHKLQKEGNDINNKYFTRKIRLRDDKKLISDKFWRDILLNANAKGIVHNGYLYVTQVLKTGSIDKDGIRRWLTSEKYIGPHKYFTNQNANWENLGDNEEIPFANIYIE